MNIVGLFNPNQPEPFRGRVTGVGKTRCNEISESIVTATRLLGDPDVKNAPCLPPVLIENTVDLN